MLIKENANITLFFFTSKTNTQAFRSHPLFHMPEPSHVNCAVSAAFVDSRRSLGVLAANPEQHSTLAGLLTGLVAATSDYAS